MIHFNYHRTKTRRHAIRSFMARDGMEFPDKYGTVAQVRRQFEDGKAVITFVRTAGSCMIILAETIRTGSR